MIHGEDLDTLRAKCSQVPTSRTCFTSRIGRRTLSSSRTTCYTGAPVGEASHSPVCTLGKEKWQGPRASLTHTLCSYDYGSSIAETRALTPKFDELKRQGLFLRSSPSFRKTDWIGDTSTGIPGVTLNGSAAFLTLLKNPDTGTNFLIARQANSTSM